MFKDHKSKGGYRQVVGGCSSNTLGLSNMISEVLESVAAAIKDPYQVISSEDLLARISDTNEEIKNMTIEFNKTRPPRSTFEPAIGKMTENDVRPADERGTVKSDIEETIREAIEKNKKGVDPPSPHGGQKSANNEKQKLDDASRNWDWREHYAMLGTDVVSMFPSLSPDRTADSVRSQVEKSSISWENIDVKTLVLYIKLNEDQISNKKILNSIRRYLPVRKQKSKRGRKPSISSKGQSDKWLWPNLNNLSRQILKRLLGIGLGVAVKFIFENFVYTFAGRYFLQKSGAPIGNRISMCASTLVMQEWRDIFKDILSLSKIRELLAALYVDDGRNLIQIIPKGVRFDEVKGRFIYRKEWEIEDEDMKMSGKERTKREILRLMNYINPDLKFTIETSEDFPDHRLPTLSFSMWEEEWGISHSYFEKSVRSQIMLMERSAMSSQSKFAINTNELRRRMEVLHDSICMDERISIIDKYTQQLLNSGYNRNQIREIIVSAMKGFIRKEKERKDELKPKFRHGKTTVSIRNRKKLIEKVTWFKNTKRKEKEGKGRQDYQNEGRNRYRHQLEKITDSPQAVIFVPYTHKSELAKRVREIIQNLKPFTRINLKVVERSGRKVIETMHRSNPWENSVCEREDCLTCNTSKKEEKSTIKSCKKRSIVYQTWCHTCRERLRLEMEAVDKEKEKLVGVDKKTKKRKRNEINATKIENMRKEEERRKELERRTFKYIGETSRSAYERGGEHLRDLNDHDPGSHLLKHVIKYHMSDPDNVEFRMKILTSHFTAFNRQITEAVKINRNVGIFLMNSKSEYNRSLLPSIRTNDSKTPWEQSDLSEEEVKEGMKALKRNGSKLKWSLKLCENDNESLIGSLHGENESLTGSRNNEDIILARFDQNVLCENVNGSLTVPLQVEVRIYLMKSLNMRKKVWHYLSLMRMKLVGNFQLLYGLSAP